MAYGIKVYDSTGFDITGNLTPVFFIEFVTEPSGSRSYGAPPAGKSLKYMAYTIMNVNTNTTSSPTVTISEGDASWSGLTSSGKIFFYWG